MVQKNKQAFSLIELLVVIAIIGILAALLIPVVGGLLRNSRTSTCNSQLGQLAKAATMYAGEHKGRLPDKDEWVEAIGAYIGEQWDSPTDPGAPPDERRMFFCPEAMKLITGTVSDTEASSYGMNENLSGKKTDIVSSKFERVMFADGVAGGSGWSNALGSAKPDPVHRKRSQEGANITFLDGHVEWVPEDMYRSKTEFWTW